MNVRELTPDQLYKLEADITAFPNDFPTITGEAVARALDAHELQHPRMD